MFVRILTAAEAKKLAFMLIDEFDPRVELNEDICSIYAPDGDLVFQALKKSPNVFLCRLHPEVFAK